MTIKKNKAKQSLEYLKKTDPLQQGVSIYTQGRENKQNRDPKAKIQDSDCTERQNCHFIRVFSPQFVAIHCSCKIAINQTHAENTEEC